MEKHGILFLSHPGLAGYIPAKDDGKHILLCLEIFHDHIKKETVCQIQVFQRFD